MQKDLSKKSTRGFPSIDEVSMVFPLKKQVVDISGVDARAFIHRLSTNSIEDLGEKKGCITAFCNEKGRMIDLVHVFSIANDHLLLLSSFAEKKQLFSWLDRFLFSENAKLADATDQYEVSAIVSKDPKLVFEGYSNQTINPFEAFGDHNRIVFRTFDVRGKKESRYQTFFTLNSTESPKTLASSEPCFEIGSPKDWEVLRINSGIAEASFEICENYNPLELHLLPAIHWNKGCYVGQEVLARLRNYNKVSRSLCLVFVDCDTHENLRPHQVIRRKNQVVGTITSISPRYLPDKASALAVVKTAILDVDDVHEIEIAGMKPKFLRFECLK